MAMSVTATDDSLLVEFASPTAAAPCAVEVQRGMIDRNIGTPSDRRIPFPLSATAEPLQLVKVLKHE